MQAIDEIDRVLAKFGLEPGEAPPARSGRRGRRKASTTRKKKRGGRSGRRIQGVKQALESALTGTPQSPGELADKVSKKVGAKVSITTQLHALKAEKKAKAVARGQWVKA